MSEKENIVCNSNLSTENSFTVSLDKRMLIFFKECPINDSETVKFCKKKAEDGDYRAMLWLARIYRDGRGVGKNKSKALEWYKKSKDYNVFSEFELLAILSNQKHKFKDVPEGLKIDTRKKEKLFVYNFDNKSMKLLVDLFPFTHYNVVGYSYGDMSQYGYNENCSDYDKILIANIDDHLAIKKELISKGIENKKIITVRQYTDKDKFDGDVIICDFGDKVSEKATWVIVPSGIGGLIWFLNAFKIFRGMPLSKCEYIVDMKNHFSSLQEYDGFGRYNPWDYFFKPMSSLTLDVAYDSKDVIISSWKPITRVRSDLKPELSEVMINKIKKEHERFENRKKVMGVICRGTDYISTQPYGHEVPLDEFELIEIVKERMDVLGFTDIYLNTEDQEVYDTFINHFEAKVFAIDQKRFKKEPKLNITLFEGIISNHFDKLLQGERYLIATCLTTKCEQAIVSSGSGSVFVRMNMKEKITEKHVKGRWGYFGNNQLIVRSHNKNRIFLNPVNKDGSQSHINSKGRVVLDNEKIVLKNIEIYLDVGIEYVCSLCHEDIKSVSLAITLFSANGEEVVSNLKLLHGSVFKVPLDVKTGILIINSMFTEAKTLGIQIEERVEFTDYESYRYSETQICIKDTLGKEYMPTGINHIDFSKRVFSIDNVEYVLDFDEADRYDKIICYNKGFLTYHAGKTEIINSTLKLTRTLISKKCLNPDHIFGEPRQFRRCSFTCDLAKNLLNNHNNNIEEALNIYNRLATNKNNNAKLALSKMYQNGIHVKKDLNVAIDWSRRAFEECPGIIQKKEHIIRLINRGSEIDNVEAFMLATDTLKNNDPSIIMQLARMYRDGKGTEKSYDTAVDLMRRVAHKKTGWSNEFFDMLWNNGTMESFEEMKNIAEIASNKEDAGAMVRLSRMYRHGKGVEINIDRAIELLERATKKDSKWKFELMNLLHESNESENLKKAFEYCSSLAGKKNFMAMEKLGCMYRDGKGTEKNFDLAIEYFRSAARGGVQQARNKLVIMLLKRGNKDDFIEAFNMASNFSKYENPGLAIHLARMYRDGLGIEKNLELAIKYMTVASFRGHDIGKKELMDLLLKRNYKGDYELALALNEDFISKNHFNALYKKACIKRDFEGDVDDSIYHMMKALGAGSEDAKSDLFYLQQAKSEWYPLSSTLSFFTKKNYKSSNYAFLKRMYDPSKPLKSLGWNTGNLGFRSAIEKLFQPDIIPSEYSNKDLLNKYDAIIIADLIYIKENADFSYLEKRLEGVTVPIVLMSVGLQSSNNKTDFKIHDSVIRILKNIQDNNIIGVRGDYTDTILNNHGIYNTQVIGCPSMYYWNDREFKVKDRQCAISTIGNFRTFSKTKLLTEKEIELIRFLEAHSSLFVEQTVEKLKVDILSDIADASNLCEYISSKGRYFYSNQEWVDEIKEYDFSIGLRFHGNVMGLRAGLKSLFITIDSRTEELTSFFNLPSLKIDDFDSSKSLSHYYKLANYSEFNSNYSKKFDMFESFVHKNGMKIINQ